MAVIEENYTLESRLDGPRLVLYHGTLFLRSQTEHQIDMIQKLPLGILVSPAMIMSMTRQISRLMKRFKRMRLKVAR